MSPESGSTTTVRSAAKRHRYPGAVPFADDAIDQRLFFGRRHEVDSFVRQLAASRLMVLYGRSGLGKTSLLQAGIFPELRRNDLLPLRVRVNRTDVEPAVMVIDDVERHCQEQGIDYTPGKTDSLWEFFKTAVFWRERALQTPVLVLDQFEEAFTLQDTGRRQRLAAELGEVLAGGLPRSIRERVKAGEAFDYSEAPPTLKVVIVLRWEYVGRLEELFPAIPSILRHRFLLKPLGRPQAEEAVVEPARVRDEAFITRPFEYQPDTLARLLDFLVEGDGAIEPFHLQLQCHHVEQKVARRQQRTETVEVDESYLGSLQDMERVLDDFYREAVDRLPSRRGRRAARRLCEKLCPEGYREPLSEAYILREFRLKQSDLDILVDAHLLRKEPQRKRFSYELAHDKLIMPVSKDRQSRQKSVVYGLVGVGLLFVALLLAFLNQYGAATEAEQVASDAKEKEETRRMATEEAYGRLLEDWEATQSRFAEIAAAQNERVAEYNRLASTYNDTLRALERSVSPVERMTNTQRLESLRGELDTLAQAFALIGGPSDGESSDRIGDPGGGERNSENGGDSGSVAASRGEGGVLEPEMVSLPGGNFVMGSERGENNERPTHRVTIAPFAMGKYEVTFGEYDEFALVTGRELPGDQGRGRGARPVVNVSWDDARAYAQWLAERTGKPYRLASEAEWEYAARAGSQTPWSFGDDKSLLGDYGWFRANSEGAAHPVGVKKPNAFGLHDVHGNVWEWVADCWHDSYDGAPADGSPWLDADQGDHCTPRVIRSGAWDRDPWLVRSAQRGLHPAAQPDFGLGFRLARDLDP